MSGTAARSRLACSSCTRRKVKCSKTTPCTNCVRRGEQHTCKADLEDNHNSPLQRNDSELNYLRRRVAELESEAETRTLHASPEALPVPADETVIEPAQPTESVAETVIANNDAVDHNAASILEFLAWGRRKDPNYQAVVSPDVHRDSMSTALDRFDESSQLSVLQLLLPSARQVWQLVDYHDGSLLWYHGSYFAPTFRAQLETFYAQHDGLIDTPSVNLQWVALLFSIMAATLACAPPARAFAWGFRDQERETLSKRWFQAIITCLNEADYTTNLTIFSCQAIATATIAAHMLGFSNTQSIHLAAAVRIAQSLALHRLGPDTCGNTVEKEIGRRVWCQLCSQDWFGIPFSESYLINPVYTTSEPPANCHDHDMVPLPSNTPTITSYCRFLREIAAIMPQLQDGLMSCNTPYTRYEQVLTWDARMRSLAIRERPVFLTNVPLDESWPPWIPWARRALAISSSHKIIMIHRSFLSDSFTNSAFAFTRRTCLAASKTIIKEYKRVVEEDGPILWIYQAFAVAASIILLLDVLHRDPSEAECTEHRQLAEGVLHILRTCRNSMIATRGVKLLNALLNEVSKILSGDSAGQGRKRRRDGSMKFDVSTFAKTFCGDNATRQPQISQQASQMDVSPSNYELNDASARPETVNLEHFDLNFAFPPAGLDNNDFGNLLYLANHDFSIL
ncbi:hypothetical protein BS50DRAFT_556749 [Corynespora cassiicola Philippines]|uniref:Zn(2)-C6 fungal-type domain-containing protein n=1 Tax=Corynespora cassiicola Philippines TaxID=1448308 RepID=A0A2T2NFW9_CORCC|nr:hypothetical protein BS50DRAFT_556749 [Corynespora cassiicola Philippines]